jgi:hypothetical protein
VGFISIFNMVGRFIWSSISDFIGRKRTYGRSCIAWFRAWVGQGTSRSSSGPSASS